MGIVVSLVREDLTPDCVRPSPIGEGDVAGSGRTVVYRSLGEEAGGFV